MARRDPYETLGVSKAATADEIKSAYRRLARRHHPDVNPDDPGAEERFKEVGEAYAVLSDPEKRQRFDRTGSMDEQGAGDFFGGAGGAGGFGDLFDMFFGAAGGAGGGAVRRGRDGDDVRLDLQLTLTDVLKGVEREVEVDRLAECDKCPTATARRTAIPRPLAPPARGRAWSPRCATPLSARSARTRRAPPAAAKAR